MGKPTIKQLLKKYKPPRKDKDFRKYWNLFLPILLEKPNFTEGHLELLKVYCDLHIKYNFMKKELESQGYYYESEGRNGYQQKETVAHKVYKDTVAQILTYAKQLGFALASEVLVEDDDGKDEDFI